MPRPKTNGIKLSADYLSLKEQSVARGDFNDCTVKALALAADIPYSLAHPLARDAGRVNGRGMSSPTCVNLIREQLAKQGKRLARFEPEAIISTYPGQHKNLRHITSHHPVRFAKQWPAGTFVCFTATHVFVVKDGVVHDWSVGRALQVQFMYRVED